MVEKFENNGEIIERNGIKFRVFKKIVINYDIHVEDFLILNEINHSVCSFESIIKTEEDKNYEAPVVGFTDELYAKLKKIANLTGLTVEKLVTSVIEQGILDAIKIAPELFLQDMNCSEKINENPSIIEKLQKV